ncbi:MAG: phospho-N-acetylmuramoyl-pentapeptide-transferase, partial [Eubacteriaceae bacterium]|nr:phospho-N-acetylmuramoyl-pentapeptide-transferase [Eubacteriaceae bacterium]
DAVGDAIEAAVPSALIVSTASHKNISIARSYAQMFRGMTYVFPVLAFSVAALIVVSTLKRMIDKERLEIGTLKALGYTRRQIRRHYLWYALLPSAVMGACLGFLCYNFNPARIFMGDTGSMALGAALAVTAVFTRTELFIVTAGMLFVIETVSVILQVGYFKLTHGRRIFKMAPIHHHFELCGWPETRVVTVFWIFTAVCVMLSMLMAHISF